VAGVAACTQSATGLTLARSFSLVTACVGRLPRHAGHLPPDGAPLARRVSGFAKLLAVRQKDTGKVAQFPG
jgi:hypothetical protein